MKEIILTKKNKNSDVDQENICSDKHKHIKCEYCEHDIYFDKDDEHVGGFGCYYVYCPHCGEETLVEDEDLELTDDNIKFPDHFYHTSTYKKNVVSITEEEVTNEIKRLVKEIEKTPDVTYRACEWGDTMIVVMNCEDEIRVFVTKDYYETSIVK